jgi:peptidylprolyl isomerase
MQKRNTIFIILAILVILTIGAIIYNMVNKNITGKVISNGSVKVLLHTNMGDIVIELREDMPITAGNFKNLTKSGVYNGVIFHRVMAGFMIQGGDPTGTGYGDKRIPMIKDEFNGEQKNNRGTIAMANAGPNTGSSQFFINLVDNNFLDGKHPVFGNVVQGMDIVDKIAKVETDSSDRPLSPVTIIEASISV